MRTMLISEFKAKCIAALKSVEQTREPIVITLRGKPLASIQPVEQATSGRRLGRLKGMMRIRGDLVRPDSSRDWEMLA